MVTRMSIDEEYYQAVAQLAGIATEGLSVLESSDPRVANLDKAKALMDMLEIPQHGDPWSAWTEVYAVDLYDILMDEEKLRVLVSKLRNKAFW
jgi:hypothetical protein